MPSRLCRVCNSKKAQKGRLVCRNCRHRSYVQADPEKAAYLNLKRHANARGIPFTITLEQFREFAVETDYLNGSGRSSKGFHVDRIQEWRGYVPGNLQRLTNSENVKKYIQYVDGRGLVTLTAPPETQGDCPF